MIQVKIEVSGGSSGEGWSLEVERTMRTVQTLASVDLDEYGTARKVLRELFLEIEGTLRDRMPAGPPKAAT